MKQRLRLKSGVELAPLVDIVFLLLAYMLINSTLSRMPAIEINLPASGATVPGPERTIDIRVRKDGGVFLNQSAVKIGELGARVSELRDSKKPIRIRADQDVRYAIVVAVMDALNAAGHTRFQLMTARKSAPAAAR